MSDKPEYVFDANIKFHADDMSSAARRVAAHLEIIARRFDDNDHLTDEEADALDAELDALDDTWYMGKISLGRAKKDGA